MMPCVEFALPVWATRTGEIVPLRSKRPIGRPRGTHKERCHVGHTEYEVRGGRRYCSECRRISNKRYQEAAAERNLLNRLQKRATRLAPQVVSAMADLDSETRRLLYEQILDDASTYVKPQNSRVVSLVEDWAGS